MAVITLRDRIEAAGQKRIKCLGVGRDPENAQSLAFYFNRAPTDDELRYFHEVMRRAAECLPYKREDGPAT